MKFMFIGGIDVATAASKSHYEDSVQKEKRA
jgi:hypothetical protein